MKEKMAAEIAQPSMRDNMNFWTWGFKIPIEIMTLSQGWLDRGDDVILKKKI